MKPVTKAQRNAMLAYSRNPIMNKQSEIIKRLKLRDHQHFCMLFHKVMRAEAIKRLKKEI